MMCFFHVLFLYFLIEIIGLFLGYVKINHYYIVSVPNFQYNNTRFISFGFIKHFFLYNLMHFRLSHQTKHLCILGSAHFWHLICINSLQW